MLSRRDILSKAVDDCLKELYTLVQPVVEWEDFRKQCEEYTNKHRDWEKNRDNYPEWKDKSINECIGPRPYEFYYLPKEILKRVVDNYIYAYRITSQDDLLNTISILKGYFEEPIIDKYIEGHTDENGFHHPGYRGYDHPDNFVSELTHKLQEICDKFEVTYKEQELSKGCIDNTLANKLAIAAHDMVHKFLDMAGNFYNWNGELNSFNMTVYLGPSPNSNKEAVIENWKKYRNTDIEIDESKWEEDEDF